MKPISLFQSFLCLCLTFGIIAVSLADEPKDQLKSTDESLAIFGEPVPPVSALTRLTEEKRLTRKPPQSIAMIPMETTLSGYHAPVLYSPLEPFPLLAQPYAPSVEEDDMEFEDHPDTIPDPLEPVNRLFFHFNDKLYFWALKPVASGYKVVVPEDVRIGVRNFFSNLTTPVRLVNCLLQGNLKGAGSETFRLLLNSTFGLAGFLDLARTELGIEKRNEDFGQTLGVWGIGPIFYVELPFLGASSLRDAVGFAGDLLLDPKTYLIRSVPVSFAIRTYDQVNDISFRIGDYEEFKRTVFDPYVAKREAYHQYRKHQIKMR